MLGVLECVGAFADPIFPAPTISVYDEHIHSWVALPEGIKRERSASAQRLASHSRRRAYRTHLNFGVRLWRNKCR